MMQTILGPLLRALEARRRQLLDDDNAAGVRQPR